MAYDPITVANRFIELAAQSGKSLTSMQLNKLTYVAHGFYLAFHKQPLIDEAVQAWKYGPVIPSLYRRLKSFGANGIPEPIKPKFWENAEDLSGPDKALIDAVFSKYGHLTGGQLSSITHKKGTPWERTFEPDVMGSAISDALIGQHYADILNAAK